MAHLGSFYGGGTSTYLEGLDANPAVAVPAGTTPYAPPVGMKVCYSAVRDASGNITVISPMVTKATDPCPSGSTEQRPTTASMGVPSTGLTPSGYGMPSGSGSSAYGPSAGSGLAPTYDMSSGVPATPPSRWWIYPTIGGLALLLGLGAYLVYRSRQKSTPTKES